MSKRSKAQKRRKRRKLSKLLTMPATVKKRLPTCQGGFALKSKKDYNRQDNKKVIRRELND